MDNPAIHFFIILSFLSFLISIFCFYFCHNISHILSQSQKREHLFAEIISLYCDIRDFSSRCKSFFKKLDSTFYIKLLDPFFIDLERSFFDANTIFINTFKNADISELRKTKSTLLEISTHIHTIMINMETRLHKTKYGF